MGFLNIANLLPREDKFYKMIDTLTLKANEATITLGELVHNPNELEWPEYGQAIKAYKDDSKLTFTEMNAEICRTFITPFDREDLQELGRCLYKIPKICNKIQARIVIHRLHPYNNDFEKLLDGVLQQTRTFGEVMQYLNQGQKMKEIDTGVKILHDLEEQVDFKYNQLIAELFYSIHDMREVVLRRDIYEMIEKLADYYRDCANLALQIVLKHS